MRDIAKKTYGNIEVKNLIENWIDGVIIGDLTGRIITVNKAEEKISGYSREELTGRAAIQTLVAKKDIPKALGMLKDILVTGHISNEEVLGIRKDGSQVYANFSASVLKNKKGLPFAIIVVVRDITEKKKLERHVSESNEILRLLNKILRHDILNDLSVASGNISLYFQYGDKKISIKDVLKDVKGVMERSIAFIGKMKQLEQAVLSGKELEPVDVGRLLKDVKKEHEDFNINIAGKAVVLADSALYSVFDNLIKNAHVHGKVDKVDINIEPKEKFVQIRVADQGKGIDDEVKKKLFQEGFKYGETGNTGLGLYIIKKTINRYGGSISVQDNVPNGTVFVLNLPKGKKQ